MKGYNISHVMGHMEDLCGPGCPGTGKYRKPAAGRAPGRRLPGMTAEPFELVIFDCDGVLVDSERIAVQVDARVFADLGCAFTEAEIVERLVGSSTEVWRAAVEERLGRPLEEGWEEPYHSWYRDALDARLTVVDGITEALDALVLPSCVASNGGHGWMRRNLARTGLFERFAGRIFSAEDVTRGSRSPTSSCTRPGPWGRTPPAARWSRTAPTGCGPPGRPGCGPSGTRVA